MKGEGSNTNETGGQDRAPLVYECTFSSFMKCNPTPFHGLDVAIGKSWGNIKKMMLEEFCPDEEVQRMEDELRSLKLRDTNIASYTQRFHELVLLCPKAVPTKKKKVERYIKGQLATTAEVWAILQKTIGGVQLQFVMNAEKRVTPRTIIQKRRTLKEKRLVDELM
nr:reverse transcriptase domain-containing protein [Tanacetum cinerariifolium]